MKTNIRAPLLEDNIHIVTQDLFVIEFRAFLRNVHELRILIITMPG